MIKHFQRSRAGRRLRKSYMKQRGWLRYLLVKSLLRGRARAAKRQFRSNLLLLHEALEGSELSNRYWVWGGLLLGWAREGGILDHDLGDADFAFSSEDRARFARSFDAIVGAGFRPLTGWKNNDGEITEYTFTKDGAKFEFFEMRPHHGEFWFNTYSPSAGLQTTNSVPAHGLEAMSFLGRTWHKPADHDAYLTSMYGNWRKPDPAWDWLEDDRSIRAVARWTGGPLPVVPPLAREASAPPPQSGAQATRAGAESTNGDHPDTPALLTITPAAGPGQLPAAAAFRKEVK